MLLEKQVQALLSYNELIPRMENQPDFSGLCRPVVFKSVGIAVEDIAAARLVYEKFIAQP